MWQYKKTNKFQAAWKQLTTPRTEKMTSENNKQISHLRGIRSFVLRQGHLSAAQERAVSELLPIYGIPYQ